MSKEVYTILYFISEIVFYSLQPIGFMYMGALASTHNLNTNYPINATSVERLATYANGCYKQRIIEPDLWNSKRFYETEQLVCPAAAAVNVSTFTMFTRLLQLNPSTTNYTTHFLPANNSSTDFINSLPNVTHVPHAAPAKSYPVVLMPPPAVSQASHSTNPTLNHQQQSFIPPMSASNVTSHTAILSKKTGFFSGLGKRTNSAKTIKSFNGCFMFMVITICLKR